MNLDLLSIEELMHEKLQSNCKYYKLYAVNRISFIQLLELYESNFDAPKSEYIFKLVETNIKSGDFYYNLIHSSLKWDYQKFDLNKRKEELKKLKIFK